MINRTERWFNRTLEQWTLDTTTEAMKDCVSLQQVYGGLSDDFGVSSEDLETEVFEVLEKMFRSGIMPVVQGVGGKLSKDPQFTGSAEVMARQIIKAVRDDPELATFTGMWLGTPR
jgi:hypothetical protein